MGQGKRVRVHWEKGTNSILTNSQEVEKGELRRQKEHVGKISGLGWVPSAESRGVFWEKISARARQKDSGKRGPLVRAKPFKKDSRH